MNAPPAGEPRKTQLALQAGNKGIYLTKKGAGTLAGASRSPRLGDWKPVASVLFLPSLRRKPESKRRGPDLPPPG